MPPACCARRLVHGYRSFDPRVCLGANLTIFAVIDSVLLRPCHFPSRPPRHNIQYLPESGRRARRLLAHQLLRTAWSYLCFTSLSIYSYGTEIIGEPGSTEREQTMRVSPDFFATLGLGL